VFAHGLSLKPKPGLQRVPPFAVQRQRSAVDPKECYAVPGMETFACESRVAPRASDAMGVPE